MYLGLFVSTLILALELAGTVSVPALATLAIALATSRVARSHRGRRPDAMGCLWVVHELSRRACVVLLAVSSGIVGAGLISVGLNVVALVLAAVCDLNVPANGAEPDMTLVGVLYFGVLTLGFLLFFAFAMNILVGWLKPNVAGKQHQAPDLAGQAKSGVSSFFRPEK